MATTLVECIAFNFSLSSPLGRASPSAVFTRKSKTSSLPLINAVSVAFPSVSRLNLTECRVRQRARCSVSLPPSQDENKPSEAFHGIKTLSVTKSEPVQVLPAAKTYNGIYLLSNIDQYYSFPLGVLFCYEADETRRTENACEVINQALAKILVHYYPFAGRLTLGLDGKYMVKCTGEGVPFVKAVANCELHELGDFTIPDREKHIQLVHNCDQTKEIVDLPLLTIQVTMFKCGGLVLGLTMNHVMADGASLMEFMKSWAKIARGLPLSVLPFLDRSILRQKQRPKIEFNHDMLFKKNYNGSGAVIHHKDEQLVDRSFCFDHEKLMQLNRLAMEDSTIKSPTNFELLTAISWQARTEALNMDPHQPTKVLITLDIRPKLRRIFPKGYFGNALTVTCCQCSAGDLIEKPLSFAVKKLQEAIELVTEDYIRSVIYHLEASREPISMENAFMMTTWSRLPFYDADFGWGAPKQFVPATLRGDTILIQSPGKDKNNLAVELCLPLLPMKAFEEFMQSKMGVQSRI